MAAGRTCAWTHACLVARRCGGLMDQEWNDWRKRCDESRSGNGSRLRPRFDQDGVAEAESLRLFEEYFAIFPWQSLPQYAVGFDAGCGSGRWAAQVAPRLGHLHCVDASSGL
jgi:hypothetical protein